MMESPRNNINWPKITVIILNWNGSADTLECIESLLQQQYSNMEIVVIDNGSDDQSIEAVCKRYSIVHLIQLPRNIGFSAGNNVGLEYAQSNNSSYALILNNDTIISDRYLLRKMVTEFTNDRLGLLCPTIHYFPPNKKAWFAGSKLSLWMGWKHLHHIPQHISGIVETGYCTGCCVMVNLQLLDDAGFLSEDYFFSVEDVEWSFRSKSMGWKVAYLPGAEIVHKESRSSKAERGKGFYSPTRVYYENRNTIWFLMGHARLIQKILIWFPFFIGNFILKSLIYVILGRWQKLNYFARAYRDGFGKKIG